jgi:hypothetical protein
MRFARRVLCAALFSGLLSAGAARADKSLHWRAMDVKARLDAAGVLHVVERHAILSTILTKARKGSADAEGGDPGSK